MRIATIVALLITQWFSLHAQRDKAIKQRVFQFSMVPALGTNGLQPGSYENYFSINLTSGYSVSTLLFEVASISNLNTNRTTGLQISGIANLTGANAFAGLTKKDKDAKSNSGFSPYLNGIQISGLTNAVIGDAHGAQVSGGINLAKGGLVGLQFSGFSNIVYKYSFGVQVSGLFNASVGSMDGVQIGSLCNYTSGQLSGVQIGAFNQAGYIEGKNSYDNTQPMGIQIGLINFAKKMNGFQFGIINFAKRSQGTQIGVINFYKGGTQTGTKDGTAIGVINAGANTYISIGCNDMFGLNYEIATGTRKNARIEMDKRNVYVTNSIIYSHLSHTGDYWGVGYGLKKMIFNRSALPGMTEARYISYGVDVQHINFKRSEITRDLSLLARLKIMVGKRITPKSFGFNWYTSLDLNTFWTKTGNYSIAPKSLKSSTRVKDLYLDYWPGFSVGLLLH